MGRRMEFGEIAREASPQVAERGLLHSGPEDPLGARNATGSTGKTINFCDRNKII